MNKTLIILITVTAFLFSCAQNSKSTNEKLKKDSNSPYANEITNEKETISIFDEQFVHTHFEYQDAGGTTLSIENSLPRGGHKYTDTAGKTFVYTIYWTRLSNQSTYPLEVKINFPGDSIPLTAANDINFKLVLPTNKVQKAPKALIHIDMPSSKTDLSERDPVYNYGLTDLASVLDQRLHKPSSLHRIIQPKDTVSFYVINLFNKGVKGVVRTGLSLEEQELFYTVNGKKILCGSIR